MNQPLFKLKETVITANARERIYLPDIAKALTRHTAGDWGDVPPEDAQANNQALLKGGRLFSAYRSVDGVKFWIITEADRSVTTVLLPEDY